MPTTDRPGAPLPALRTATPADLPAIERLLADAGLPTAGVSELVTGCPDDVVVAEDPQAPGELAAVAGLEVRSGSALLRSVAVRPAWREQGLGRTLVRHVVHRAEARRLDALYLLTTTAEHYFPRFGFERIERGTVPSAIAATVEFRSACPASAVAMARTLGRTGRAGGPGGRDGAVG